MEQQVTPVEKAEDAGTNGETKKSLYTKIPLSELGPTLPLGTRDANTGGLDKSMAHRNWTLKTEKALGKLRDKKREANQARFASMVISKLYEQLGAVKLTGDSKKLNQDLMHVGQMWMGDVLYAYLYLRWEFVGSTFDMDFTCPGCLGKSTIKADLDTVEVRTVEKMEDAYWEYELKHPFQARKQEVKVLSMGPARWNGIERASGGGIDTGGTKSSIIWSSLRDVKNADFKSPLTENELEDMSKYDLERLTNLINEHHVGPDMSIEGTCDKPGCGRDFRMSIDWTYDNFFAVSGPSSP